MKFNVLLIAILSLLMFSCIDNQLPTINVVYDEDISWDEKDECKIIYSDSYRSFEANAGVKRRGGISRQYYKHSFTIEFYNKFPLLGLPKDDDWILNANCIDKTFMRHKISYDIFREMNSNNIAPKSDYINLSLNGEYEGLYILMQKMNAKTLGVDKKDDMAMVFKEPPIFYKNKLEFVRDSLNYYDQRFPKIYKLDKTKYIESLKDFLFNASDAEFAKNIGKWFDIENVIDWHIILLFTNNSDGIMKNFFLYKIDSETPLRFALWDYDHSFGRDGDNELNMLDRVLDCNRSVLLKRLSEIPETKYLPKLKKRWFELREADIISYDNFAYHIEKNDNIIRKHVEKNFEKWPVNSEWYYDDNNYEQELEIMLKYAKIRIKQLDEYFEGID